MPFASLIAMVLEGSADRSRGLSSRLHFNTKRNLQMPKSHPEYERGFRDGAASRDQRISELENELKSAEAQVAPMGAVYDASHEIKRTMKLDDALSPAGVIRVLASKLAAAHQANEEVWSKPIDEYVESRERALRSNEASLDERNRLLDQQSAACTIKRLIATAARGKSVEDNPS